MKRGFLLDLRTWWIGALLVYFVFTLFDLTSFASHFCIGPCPSAPPPSQVVLGDIVGQFTPYSVGYLILVADSFARWNTLGQQGLHTQVFIFVLLPFVFSVAVFLFGERWLRKYQFDVGQKITVNLSILFVLTIMVESLMKIVATKNLFFGIPTLSSVLIPLCVLICCWGYFFRNKTPTLP